MISYHGNTNDAACKNYGYRKLTCNGCYVDISSGGHNYGLNERCFWGIYAPGARILRFQLTNTMDVSNTIHINKGCSITRGGILVPYFHDKLPAYQ